MVTTTSPLSSQGTSGASPADVEIRIEVDSAGRTRVTERFRTAADSALQEGRYQLLARPCAVIGAVAIAGDDRTAPLRVASNDPWQLLTDTANVGAGASTIVIQYQVSRPGGGNIPLVVPTHAIPHRDGARTGSIRLTVRLPDPSARVTFPRVVSLPGTNEWQGQFVAIPSFVNVRLSSGDRPCDTAAPTGRDGGLVWRFWLLVAILVLWVPTYQWWAGRTREGDE
ncbi:MAG: hypothetical protein ABI910_07775 [Gemmatimonadota bacterium]